MIGGHLGFSKNLLPTLIDAKENEMKSVQFFLGNPKSFHRHRISEKDLCDCKSFLSDGNCINVFSHYPYTSSLVGSVASLAWDGNLEQDKKTSLILSELEYEINILSKICEKNVKNGVVIHPGSFKNRIQGLETIAKSINKINFEPNATLLLENSAGEGTKLPKDFKELKHIFDNIDSSKRNNVKCCIDTAHVWGSGIYDLQKTDEIDKMFFEFDKFIGLDKFGLLHLNDSMVEFKSKKDRHENLGYGFIWKDDNTSLIYLLNKCSENNIPIVLETPNVIQDMYICNDIFEK